MVGQFGHLRPGHEAVVDLPHRHSPGHRSAQVHGILDRHRVRAREIAGQELPHRACHQHHFGAGPGVRECRLGGHHHSRGHSGSVLVYAGTNPVFVAYGVAMCGIGLLTLTGNTISMDVFGPVADNANGIGEMGYNRDTNNQELKPGDPDYMDPEKYKTCPANPGRPGRRGQHNQGDHQGNRHRLSRGRRRVLVRQLHRGRGHGFGRGHQPVDHGEISRRGRQADRGRSLRVHRHAHRRGGAVPVQQHDHSGRRPGGVSDRAGMPDASSATRKSGPGPRSPTMAGSSISAPAPPRRNWSAQVCWPFSRRSWSASPWAPPPSAASSPA